MDKKASTEPDLATSADAANQKYSWGEWAFLTIGILGFTFIHQATQNWAESRWENWWIALGFSSVLVALIWMPFLFGIAYLWLYFVRRGNRKDADSKQNP